MERLSDGTHRTMIRFGTKQRRRFRITTRDEAEAAERERALIELGAAIGKAKIDPEIGARILEQAGAGEVARARNALDRATAEAWRLELDAPKKGAPGAIKTFAQLGEAWTSGRLAAEHPDHIRVKRSAHKDAERLVVLCKTIGDVPIKRFVLADAKRAMAALPKLASATRRAYAQIIGRLLALAVYPLELIPTNPLPRGFLPKVTRTRATAWLYPAEEAQLLACEHVPLVRRVLYGFLAREGLRCGEALALTWADLDLVRGVVRLDKNKTNDPRAWALTAGVAPVLALVKHKRMAEPGELAFYVPNEARLADAFRADLRLAKIDRAELFERSPTRRPIRVHDLRATFVTLSLAAGRSETWVADRTGHRSSTMINAYRRAARTAAELGLGELARLDEALAWRETATPNAGQYSAGPRHG